MAGGSGVPTVILFSSSLGKPTAGASDLNHPAGCSGIQPPGRIGGTVVSQGDCHDGFSCSTSRTLRYGTGKSPGAGHHDGAVAPSESDPGCIGFDGSGPSDAVCAATGVGNRGSADSDTRCVDFGIDGGRCCGNALLRSFRSFGVCDQGPAAVVYACTRARYELRNAGARGKCRATDWRRVQAIQSRQADSGHAEPQQAGKTAAWFGGGTGVAVSERAGGNHWTAGSCRSGGGQ